MNSDRHADSYRDSNCYPNGNGNTNSDSDADSNTYAYAMSVRQAVNRVWHICIFEHGNRCGCW